MVGGGSETTEGLRSRVARGSPNWWVILAVSLALMALLVATAENRPHPARQSGALGSAGTGDLRNQSQSLCCLRSRTNCIKLPGGKEAVGKIDWLPDIGADARLQRLLVKLAGDANVDGLKRNRFCYGE